MFCTHCGCEVKATDSFCPACGASLNHPAMVNAQQVEQPVGSARQALPTSEPRVQPPVQGRPYTGQPYARQEGGSSQRGMRDALRQRGQSQAPAYPAAQNQRSGVPRNLAIYVALGAIALIAAVALAVVRPFQGFGPSGNAAPVPAEQPAQTPEQQPAEQPAQEEPAAGEGGIAVRTGLADYSWDELDQIAGLIESCGTRDEALAIAREYNLVDSSGHFASATKSVSLSDGQVLNFRLVDVWCDAAATQSGRAGMAFLATNVAYHHRMAPGKTTDGGWEASELRQWLSTDVLAKLPEEVAAVIQPVSKWSNNQGKTTSSDCVSDTLDTLWVPSIVEVCGPVSWTFDSDPKNSAYYNAVFNAEGEQYAAFAQEHVVSDEDNPALALGESWWLRSTAAS